MEHKNIDGLGYVDTVIIASALWHSMCLELYATHRREDTELF